MHGGPDEKSSLPVDPAAYWNFRSELVIVDGVIYKGHKVVIPSVMRSSMIEKIHAFHLGV